MKPISITLYGLFFLLLTSCSTKPKPFAYGKDNCHTCKMGIMDPKFGSELITTKGKIYKFDDVSCMQHFLKSLEEAVFILSPSVKSPMGSHAAAFASREKAEKMNATFTGELLSWKELAGKLDQ